MVTASSKAIFKSEDGGNYWKQIYAGSGRLIDFSSPKNGLVLKNKDRCIASFSVPNDHFATTNDGGDSWVGSEETTSNLVSYFSRSQKIAAGKIFVLFRHQPVGIGKKLAIGAGSATFR